MSVISNGTAHVPAFLAKLWKIVDDPSTNDLICWSEHGNSFIIHNQSDFARDLLPLYYKHNNMASFVRQLNMYGFHKVVSVEHGGLRVEKDEMEFAHPFFLQGQEDSLELIKRKVSSAKFDDSRLRPDTYNKVLMDVHQMKGRQESMDSKLLQIRRENEALWSELASLRQKHAKQQQIVSKLIQFLVSMMSTQSHRIGFKRRLPLMLSDTDETLKDSKVARTGKKPKTTGAVIHDVTESADGDGAVVVVDGQNFVDTTDPNLFVTEILDGQMDQAQGPIVAAPNSAPATPDPTPAPTVAPKTIIAEEVTSSTNGGGNINMNQVQVPVQTVATSSAADPQLFLAEELDGHLGQTQSVLDNLRDLLMGTQYNFDPNTLTGVSSPSNLLTLFAPDTDLVIKDGKKNDQNQNKDLVTPEMEGAPLVGNELTSYNPCLFELAEDDAHFFEDPAGNMFLDAELENMLTTDKSKLAGGT